MNNFFVHYYYGNEENAWYTAIGTAIRVLGYNMTVQIYYSRKFKPLIDFLISLNKNKENLAIYELEEKKSLQQQIMEFSPNNAPPALILITSIELFENDLTKFCSQIELLKKHSEIILMSNKEIKEIERISEYTTKYELSKL